MLRCILALHQQKMYHTFSPPLWLLFSTRPAWAGPNACELLACRHEPKSPVVQAPILGVHSEFWFYSEQAKDDKPLVAITPGKMHLFIKMYDPWQQRLSYLGRCYAHDTNTLRGLMPFLYRKTGLPAGTALEVSPVCLATTV